MIAVTLAHAGCTDYLTPEVGPPQARRCDDVDSEPAQLVSFARDIMPILERDKGGCINCHTPGAATPIGFEPGELDVSTVRSLRERDAIVVPGRPCSSTLVDKLGPAPALGARMPQNGPPFLNDTERQLVSDWIFEGAADN